MKRFLTILILILSIVAVFLGISWLVSRKSAQKSGNTPQTFREFITGDTVPGSATSTDDSLSGAFTTPPDGTLDDGTSLIKPGPDGVYGTQDDISTPPSPAGAPTDTRISIFTNTGALNPGDTTPPSTSSGVAPANQPGIKTPIPVPVRDTFAGATVVGGNDCTDADQNIVFTPQELAQLRALQNRFYAVATTLHTDADVAAEFANYNTFDLKARKINELANYCTNHIAQVVAANPIYGTTVATPYWGAPLKDSLYGFFSKAATPQGGITPPDYGGPFDINDLTSGLRNVERALRLNLW